MNGWQYYNMDAEQKERLERKSYFMFKSKHRWRKIEDRIGCGPDEIEKQLDRLIEIEGKKLQIMRKIKGEANNAKELDRKNARRNGRRS